MRDEPKSFIEHLSELRRRLVISAFATAAGTVVSFILKNPLFDFKTGLLTLPLRLRPSDLMASFLGALSRAGMGSFVLSLFQLFFRSQTYNANTITLVSIAPLEKFTVVFKAAFAVGVLMASPVILYQMWAFILPALKDRERSYLIPLFFIALFFFSVGAVFAFFVVVPVSIPILAGFLPSVENRWTLDSYFTFVTRMMLAFGAAFELPIVMGFIAKIGLINAEGFKGKRKIAVVLVFIVSAGLTPTQDPFTMFLMAIPLLGLYELGIRFAMIVGTGEARLFSG